MKFRYYLLLIAGLLILACAPVTINIGLSNPEPTAALPDLVITSSIISMVDVNGNCLGEYEVGANVLNQGSAPAENVVVQEFATGHQVIVGTLGVGQSMYIQFPAGSPTGRYLLLADPQNLVTEREETNNQSSPSLPAATPPPYCLQFLPITPTATPFDLNMYTPALNMNYFPPFSAPSLWKTYTDPYSSYTIQYPPTAILDRTSERTVIRLPFKDGTQLSEKAIWIQTFMALSDSCYGQMVWEGTTVSNGSEMKYSGGNHWENAMGGLSFVPGEYAVYKNGICYRLSIRMSTQNSSGFNEATPRSTPEPSDLDFTVLLNIVSTFRVP